VLLLQAYFFLMGRGWV